ncbi:MAG: ATP-binding protein [Halanaerobiales bacterium]
MKLNKLVSNSLFSKIFIRFILISLIVIIIFGTSLIYYFRGFFYNNKEEEIINNTNAIINHISQTTLEEDKGLIENWIRLIATINGGQAWLIDKNGYLVMSYPFNIDQNDQVIFKEYEKIFEGEIIRQRVESSHFDKPMLLVGMPVENQNEPDYGLLIFTSVAGINSTIEQIQKITIFISAGAVILILLVSYLWSKSLTKPLQKISKTAIQLSKGNLGETVNIKGEDEINVVAESLNYLSSTLKETVDDLKEEKNKLKHVLKGMNEGVIVYNKDKEIILSNSPAKKLLKLNTNFEGEYFDNIIEDEQILDLFDQSIKREDDLQKELNIGNNKVVIIYCSPIYNKKDNFWGVVALIRDISERWRFEQMQKQFITNVSHELKTPLSSIKGAGEVLDDGIIENEKTKQEYYEMIIKESNRLENMVENILSISRLEEGSKEDKNQIVTVQELFNETIQIFREKTDVKKNLTVINPKQKLKIKVNKNEIKQALINLLDNALKFSNDHVDIELGAEKVENKVKIWVQDQGIGIKKDELKNIWERFYQVDKSRTQNQKGSGLGLSIVKKLVEKNEGEVYLKSKINQGSEFGLYLPLES